MFVKRITIHGFKIFRDFAVELNKHLNVFVGDNESGKTTIIEAINLVLSCQIDGRSLYYGLDPYLFNSETVKDYFAAIRQGKKPPPPHILIEAYLSDADTPDLARLKGTHNTRKEDSPGQYLSITLNEELADDFQRYVTDSATADLIPIEYFAVAWRSFAGNSLNARNLPVRATIIDTSLARTYSGPNKYLAQIIGECLDEKQRILLSAAYRQLRRSFAQQAGIQDINTHLADKKGDITAKTLTVSLDMSARSTWDSSITAHLDDIPFEDVGKGEQCRVQMKLAIASASASNVMLIEEPENHLSHSNMARLIDEIGKAGAGRQIVVTTHSSFVLNKLGIHSVILLSFRGTTKLSDLSAETRDYFMKLPGYNTLRLLLSSRIILVEGPSDELIVQRAYLAQHKKLPLTDGVDVIAVGALAFKRFLEVGSKLGLTMRVVTDNDGDVKALTAKYQEYLGGQNCAIRIVYDTDETCRTLEPQLLKANSLNALNKVLGTTFGSDADLLSYMTRNKTDCALKVFATKDPIAFPEYIRRAIML